MNSRRLLNKKILFFSPAFFSYETRIKDAMEQMGATVQMYDERAVVSPFSRALLKIFPFVFNGKSNRYYRRIIKENSKENFDFVLIIRCDMVTEKTILMLKAVFPNAKLCLHLWDSMTNVKGIEKKIGLFDYATSFDTGDCERHHQLSFRPLFYVEEFCNKTSEIKYDLCFCGTIHSDREFIINRVFEQAERKGLSTYKFAYLQAKFIYYFYKIFSKGFKKASKSSFSFEKKTIKEISEIEESSNVVLDIQHPNQTGLTMRTIEMVGAQKKFITTNRDIIKYDFYNPNNIFVIDRENPQLDFEFFEKTYEPIPKDVYRKYDLNQWVLDVLGVDA